MVIRSNFKDYYDALRALGQDPSLIYIRVSQTFSLARHNGDAEKRELAKVIREMVPRYLDTGNRFGWEEVILGFCGKLYLVIRHKELIPPADPHGHLHPAKYNVKHYYDTESLRKAFPEAEKAGSRYLYSWEKGRSTLPSLGVYDENDDVFIRLGAPVFVIEPDGVKGLDEWGRPTSEDALVTNPSLKSLDFYRVVSDYEAFQQLEMYLSNVLVGPRMQDAPLTDKQKVTNHGFDPQYGFRKRKAE